MPRPEIEFYDLETDPWDLTTLASEDACRAHLQAHFSELAAWRENTGDFPPHRRRRDGHTDRVTGRFFHDVIPPMRDL